MRGMRQKTKRLGLCLLLALTLLLGGCQTSEVQKEQAEAETKTTAESQDAAEPSETEDTEEPEYIDGDYVEEHYGDQEEEDLSKYKTGTGKSKTTADSTGTGTDSTGKTTGSTGTSTSSGETASADNYYTDPVPEGKPTPVEPQDQVVDSEERLTCTLYVECSTILNNMDDLTEGKESQVPADGVIYGPKTVTFSAGESVYDILQREMQNNRIHMESQFTAMYNSAYVQGINNLYEKDCGALSGWMYCVNGWYPNYGCSRYQVQSGDVIEWHYTCDLGNDLGAGMS